MGKFENPEKKRARNRAYYRRTIARQTIRSREKTRRIIDAVKALLLAYLKGHPCVDCGESDPVVLEFDHCDPKVKAFTMAEARRGKKTLRRVCEELEKCEVRCANCHRRRTMRQAATGEIKFGIPIRKIAGKAPSGSL